MGELHKRFAAALAELADIHGMTREVDASDRRPDWWPAGARWRQTFGRFDPDSPAYATLAWETSTEPTVIVLVKAYLHPPEHASSRRWIRGGPDVGVLQLRAFPDDPRLSTLSGVINDSPQVRVVRYRPEKRCTLRVGSGPDIRWAKVFSGMEGDAIHRTQQALWEAAQRGELDMTVASPIGFDPASRTVWIGHVPGDLITTRIFSPEGPTLAQRLGSAAGSVTRITATPAARTDGAAQITRSRRNAETIARYLPELAPALSEVISGLERLHSGASARPRPIHGAPHPEQWLDHSGYLGLIDFDRFSLGDPELDITTFQAEVDFERIPETLRDDINGAFLAGYESQAGPMDHSLLRAYRVHKRLAKVLRTARAIRPDGDARAARHLQRVTELLSG